jgi:hypothetical protein
VTASILPDLFLKGVLPLTHLIKFSLLLSLPCFHCLLIFCFCYETEYLVQLSRLLMPLVLISYLLIVIPSDLILITSHILSEDSEIL